MEGLLQILRDQVWQFVGALFSLIAIGISVWVAFRQRREKALKIERSFGGLVISHPNEMKDKLEIRFEGMTVTEPYLLEVSVENSGNVPILASDFVRPLCLSFGDESQILQARISEQKPENLSASVKVESGRVTLEPLLLNPGDLCRVSVLGMQIDDFDADARVVGAEIRSFPEDADLAPTIRGLAPMASLLVALGILAAVLQSSFIWGFLVAGVVGFALQRIRLCTVQHKR